MIKLIKYELFKISGKKLFWAMLLSVLVLNVFVLWWANKGDETTPNYKDYNEIYNSISSLSNKDKVKYLNKEKKIVDAISAKENIEFLRAENRNDIFTKSTEQEYKEIHKKYKNILDKEHDYNKNSRKSEVITESLAQFDELSKYNEKLDEVQFRAEILSTSSIFGGGDENSFNNLNIKKTSSDFKSIEDIKIKYDINKGVNLFLKLSITDMLILFMVLFSVTCLITDEKEKELFYIVKATRKGNLQTISAKLSALFLAVFFVGGLTILSNYLFISFTYGFGDVNRSIQSIPQFMNSTLKLNVSQYLLLISSCKIVGAFIIGLIMSLIALVTKNKIFVLIDSLVLLVLSLITFFSIPMSSKFNWFKVINITNFIVPNNVYGKYFNLNLFGKPINISLVFLLFSIIAIIVFVCVNICVFTKTKQLTCKSSNKIKFKILKFNNNFVPKHQTTYELKKILSANQVVVIILLFVGLQIYSAVNIPDTKDVGDVYYKNYMQAVEGKLTPAKEKFILKQKAKFDNANNKLDKINEDYANGKISWGEKLTKEDKLQKDLNGEFAFSKVYSRYEYIKSHKKAEFVYDTGYNKLFNIEDEDFGLVNSLELIIVLAVCLSGVFSVDYKTGMYKVLSASKNGIKNTINKKLIISAFIALIITTVAYIPNFYEIKELYGFRKLGAPISSLPAFEKLGSSVTIFGYISILFVTRILFVFLLSLIILGLSLIIKNNIYTAVVTIGVFVSPMILHVLEINIFDKISFIPLILTNCYYLGSQKTIVSVMQILILILISILSLNIIYKRFGKANTLKIK